VTLNATVRDQDPRDIPLATVFARYFDKHGRHTIGAGVQRRNLAMILDHAPEMMVGEFTMDVQQEVTRKLLAAGYQNGTVKRVMGGGKAAIGWAWRNGLIKAPVPFLSLPEGTVRERVLTITEMAQLWDAAAQPHLRAFLAFLIGTASRPAAVLELTRDQCDVARRRIDLNPAGRRQTKKRRPVVAMPDFLIPWIEAVPAGSLIAYRDQAITKINASWRIARDIAGLGPEVVPTTIRHTIATELRARSVPELEIAGLLGHVMPNVRTTGRYAKYAPDYLSKAREAIDQIANEIGRVAAHPISPETSVRVSCVLVPKPQGSVTPWKTGAGEGIRTLDPNLGKVVLYP